jgi:Mg-chelatase subunit ChlD
MWQAHVDTNGKLWFDMQITPPPPQQGQQGSPSNQPPTKQLEDMLSKMPSKGGGGDKKDDKQNNGGNSEPPMNDKVFRSKLASVMLDNKYDRRIKGRTRGKLDMKALYKVPTLARSIFSQKQACKNKEYDIVLLVDTSGSMCDRDRNGRRRDEAAAEACNFLLRSFEGLNINTMVIGYTDTFQVLKDFSEKPDYKKIANGLRGEDGTPTYQAMNRAYQLLKPKKGKKILMVLTDGEPGGRISRYIDSKGKEESIDKIHREIGYARDENYEWRSKKELHALADKNKDVTTIGVGINKDCEKVAKNNILVKNLEDLKPKMISILKKQIKRG